MKQVSLGAGIVNYPMPVALAGTKVDGKDNFMTVAWLSMVSFNPPRIAISLGPHVTRTAIKETGAFSVCFPSAEDMVDVDYCGIVSGGKVDKSDVFETFTGQTGAPMVESCKLNVECRLSHVDANGSNETMVGDIVDVYADESVLTDGKVDLAKLNPLVLSQLDAKYLMLGARIGRAWGAGRERVQDKDTLDLKHPSGSSKNTER